MTGKNAFTVSQDFVILEPKSGPAFPILCAEWELLKAKLRKISAPPWIYEACASVLAGVSLTMLINIWTGMLPSPSDHPKASVIAWAVCLSTGLLALAFVGFSIERRRMKCVYVSDVIGDMELIEHRFAPDTKSALGAKSFPTGDLVILDARYGSGEHRADVTQKLNDAIVDSKLHIFVGNQIVGDPCPNVVKNIEVRFRYKNEEGEAVVAEGSDLDLPPKIVPR